MGISYQRVIDNSRLQLFQDRFCAATGLYAYCVDSTGTSITQMSGNEQDVKRLKELISEDQFQALFHTVADGALEDQAVENTAIPNIKYAAIAMRDGSRAILTWLVCCVLADAENAEYLEMPATDFSYMLSTEQFNSAMDLLREGTKEIIGNKLSVVSAREESRRSEFSKWEIEAVLKRTEAMTEVVQFLDHDEAIESVLEQILQVIGSYLNISSTYLYRINQQDDKLADIIAQWNNSGVVSRYDQTRNQPRPSYLYQEKLLVVSSGNIPEAYRGEMDEAEIQALAAMPIYLKDKISMYISFEEKTRPHVWSIEEIKFINDASKILQSILQRRIHKNSLASSYAALEAVLDNVGNSIYVRDKESGRILFVNKRLRSSLRMELERDLLKEIFESKIPEKESKGSIEVHYDDADRWYELFYTNIAWVDGREALLCSLHEVTEKKIYQRRIEQQAYTDFLTGLYNRMCCERDLSKYIDTAKKMGIEGTLLYLDLDDFKHINDGLGHQYGDVLLKSISHSIQRIHGIENTCYRMGGDEFVIIIPPSKTIEFDKIIEGIKEVFSKPWFLKDADYYCTMSMGYVHFPSEGEEVQDLIKKADIAMYEAKKSGKNRVAAYKSGTDSASNKRLDMEKNMRDATLDDYKEFEVYYQPIIDIQTPDNACIGAEALIRWNSSELGFISPADFIPLAEYLGLINPIGNYVLRQACETCKKWNESGHPEYKVNVNLSVVQLVQTDIVDTVAQTLKETGINPGNLTLEVTESLAINDMERMKEILHSIKKLGVRIALDDFGTGYSSLNHIREIPFDVIKVDQSFVKDLAKDSYSQAFIRMVSDLADTIGVAICVEGIEREEQYKILEGMKVRMIQGFYFDRPMPQAAFEEKYLTNHIKEKDNSVHKKSTQK
ncbi:MAG: EAL domain-containing protein [Lachnospiraceae bacterium]|nr:EAL domain-containing protein [Lachnospiraceae bacterium]